MGKENEKRCNRWLTSLNLYREGHVFNQLTLRDPESKFAEELVAWVEDLVRRLPQFGDLPPGCLEDLGHEVYILMAPRVERGECPFISEKILNCRIRDARRSLTRHQRVRTVSFEQGWEPLAEDRAVTELPCPADIPPVLEAALAGIAPHDPRFTVPRKQVFRAWAEHLQRTGSKKHFPDDHPMLFRSGGNQVMKSRAVTKLLEDLFRQLSRLLPSLQPLVSKPGAASRRLTEILQLNDLNPDSPRIRPRRIPILGDAEICFPRFATDHLIRLVRAHHLGWTYGQIYQRVYSKQANGSEFVARQLLEDDLDTLVGCLREVLRPGTRYVVGGVRAAGMLGLWPQGRGR